MDNGMKPETPVTFNDTPYYIRLHSVAPEVFDDSGTGTEAPLSIWDDIDKDLQKLEVDGLYRTVGELRGQLSAALFERDIYWPLAFCIGLLLGLGSRYVI